MLDTKECQLNSTLFRQDKILENNFVFNTHRHKLLLELFYLWQL